MKLAVSGKGGVGKTTIAAGLIRRLAEEMDRVYAIDADPDACLAAAIGISEEIAWQIKPVVEMKELIRAKSGEGAFYVLNPELDDIDDYCYRLGNIWFLRMGEIKKGGSECYCRENTFLHALVSTLLLDRKEAVVMDMGAGIEHLTRGTARSVDIMLVVVEPNRSSINTARNVKRLAKDLGIPRVCFIGNKVNSREEREFIASSLAEDEILGYVSFHSLVWEKARDNPADADVWEALAPEIEVIFNQLKRKVGD